MQVTQEAQIWSLAQKDPQEKEMETHPVILAWEIPRTEEPVGYCQWSSKESDATECLSTHTLIFIWQPCTLRDQHSPWKP